jgi:hypothetical protein
MGEAINRLQADYERSNELKRKISDAMKDDRTTPESNRIAVEALGHPSAGAGISDERAVAQSYINESGLTTDQIRHIVSEINGGQHIGGAMPVGNKSGLPTYEFATQVKSMADVLAPAIGRAVAAAVHGGPAPALSFDGNPVSRAIKNATDRRRRL